ncbi:emerin homolog 1 [Anabas testudineus]|uniref:emerin homolog 1 n=1 Tax=Anabas testudineus TaxID=64144 RepID=UPI000E456D2B|nr:emerin homolog 1 [Anabas testudineus]
MSLSGKSNDEIKKLLAEYGIKHGPVVDTTRKQYEKKLEKAMEKSPVKSSSDKTYYREEEEEVTYITYRSPVRDEGVEMLKRRGIIALDEDQEPVQASQSHFTSRTVNNSTVQSRVQSRGPAAKSRGSVWKVIRLLLLLAVLAAVLYYAYCHLWS